MLSIGEFAGSPLPRTRLIVEAFRESGVDARLAEKLTAEQEEAAEKLKEAKKAGKPVLMKVYREGMTRFVAISPRAA